MLPGTYTATLYQGELEAGTGSVTVSAGKTSSLTLTSSLNVPSTIWSIGTVDGTPSGVRFAFICPFNLPHKVTATPIVLERGQDRDNAPVSLDSQIRSIAGIHNCLMYDQVRLENEQLGPHHFHHRLEFCLIFPYGSVQECASVLGLDSQTSEAFIIG